MKIIINDNNIEYIENNVMEELIIIQNSANADICNKQYNSFSNILSILLDDYQNIKILKLIKINCNMFNELEQYNQNMCKLENLTINYCDISENDMLLLGPCFSNVKKLYWHTNRFDESLYEQYIEPYFDMNFNMDYENDDGWYPGCEIWGDGQSLQYKNNDFYF
jgi:hypothetical protein